MDMQGSQLTGQLPNRTFLGICLVPVNLLGSDPLGRDVARDVGFEFSGCLHLPHSSPLFERVTSSPNTSTESR